MVFRDGFGTRDKELEYIQNYEIPRLRAALEMVYKENEQNMPKLSVVVVTRNSNSFLLLKKGQGNAVKYANVPPGTVLDHTITREGR